jgi:exosortase/archaeosortase family protein
MGVVTQARLSPGLRFGLRFFFFLMGATLVFWAFSLHEHLGFLQRAITTASAFTARLAGGQALAQNHDIIVNSMVININHECTGIFVFMLFASFVLAYPASWSARAIGFGIGIPALFAVNILRLATLARIVEVYPSLFFYFHEYVWQGVFMVFVLVGAIAWAERFG